MTKEDYILKLIEIENFFIEAGGYNLSETSARFILNQISTLNDKCKDDENISIEEWKSIFSDVKELVDFLKEFIRKNAKPGATTFKAVHTFKELNDIKEKEGVISYVIDEHRMYVYYNDSWQTIGEGL